VARTCDIDSNLGTFVDSLRKAIQSARLNFLIGAGCSVPAIAPLGNIEIQVQELYEQDKTEEAESLIFDFLKPFLDVSCKIISGDRAGDIGITLNNYRNFLSIVSKILFKNTNNILPKQANIFSTNYDLFVETAAEDVRGGIRVADGFIRGPSVMSSFPFLMSEFFTSFYNTGHSYNYRVEMPTLNLVKLHGSLTWERSEDTIRFSINQLNDLKSEHEALSTTLSLDGNESFNRKFCLVLPRKHEKFRDVLLTRTYYDMLRLYANQLDKENALLIAEGVSYADEHILGMTQGALNNPTLKLVVFSHSKDNVESYAEKFQPFNNVEIIYSESGSIDFEKFNSILTQVGPSL
jgi:hypothetical protein